MRRFLLLFGVATLLGAANPDLLTKPWSARWIGVPDTWPSEFGVYRFRKTFQLAAKPQSFLVHVSGDNRYQLFVNGERVSLGPARGDLFHWRYETVDIAAQLRAGRNVLAAVVWNFADQAPQAQITYRSGFLLQGDGERQRAVDTGKSWRCLSDRSYQISTPRLPGYYAAGPAERVDAAAFPWGWQQPEYDDTAWGPAEELGTAAPREASDTRSRWMLEPRSILAMAMKSERLARLRGSEGVHPPAGFPASAVSFAIPANTRATFLLDQGYLTTAYPELTVSGGKGAQIRIGYAESLYRHGSTSDKGNRDEIEGKDFIGLFDTFLPDGAAQRVYAPLWWRTYRYVRLEIATAAEPLELVDFHGIYTGYPFARQASFDAANPELQQILDIGWRTARLCAHETYMDCPYWEQLQYVGDTRVQALVSLHMTGDAKLMRNALTTLDASRTAEGLTYSRAPSRLPQYIPGFSLWWIGMLHDYWMYQDDPRFVKSLLPGVHAILSYFDAHRTADGALGAMPWWNYLDWATQWGRGVPPRADQGGSAAYDLQLLLAYQWAADLEEHLGLPPLAAEYRQQTTRLAALVRNRYWDSARRMFADTAEKKAFSQQTNALAVLAGVLENDSARDLMSRVAQDASLVPCSIYFRYYLNAAMTKAGLGDRYLDMLGPWRRQLSLGLTTWAETDEPSRSDCHAWGAIPNIEVFRTVLGISSAAPGFQRERFHPNLGTLQHASGTMPHPKGEIAVRLTKEGTGLEADVALPAGVEGEFEWGGQRRELRSGKQHLHF